MDDVAGNSSASANNEKPVIVRVKRKAHQSPLEAFWLEISERPLKRPFLDFQKLSIGDSAAKVEEMKTKKVFVRHVETISSSEFCIDALQPHIHTGTVGGSESKQKIDGRRQNLKTENKQHKLLLKAKEKQNVLSKNARFEQIWRSRKGKREVSDDDGLHESCHIYDVIRVDVEETSKEPQEHEDEELEDHRIMASYLPLLKEFIPSAAAELESNIYDYVSKRASKDGYVYDLYTVKDDIDIEEDASNPFPLVQVNEGDEFYDGPDESEHDSDDSNAEDNPLNDYPDEEPSEDDEDDSGSRSTKDESEEADDSESGSVESSSESLNLEHHKRTLELDSIYDGDFCCDDDCDDCDGDSYSLGGDGGDGGDDTDMIL